METQELKDIEILETIELKFGLADSKEKIQALINSFLIPLLNKLETGSQTIKNKLFKIFAHINLVIKNEAEIILPISDLFELLEKKEQNTLTFNFTCIYLQKALNGTVVTSKSQYVPKLLSILKSISPQQYTYIDTIIISILCEIGCSDNLKHVDTLFNNKNDLLHLLNLARDFFSLTFNQAKNSQNIPVIHGLSELAFNMLTINKTAKWIKSEEELQKAKLSVLGIVMLDKLFVEYNSVNERFLAVLFASCNSNYNISKISTEFLKHIDLPNYENSDFINQIYVFFLGGSLLNDSYGTRQPCSIKFRLSLIKILYKSKTAASMVSQWLKVIFESFFGSLTSDQLKKESVSFMKWVLEQSESRTLLSVGPVLIQAIKKILGLSDNSSFLSSYDEIVKIKAYSCWAILATKLPEMFGKNIDDFEMLIKLLETEPKSLHLEIQEVLYATGKSIFQHTENNQTLQSKIFNIIEENILSSSSNHLKLTLLRLLKDGPKFANTRARAICILACGDNDQHVKHFSESILKMDLNSLKIAIPILTENGFEDSSYGFVTEFFKVLPPVNKWVIQALELITTGKSIDIFDDSVTEAQSRINMLIFDRKLKKKKFINDFSISINSKSLEMLVDYTFQLITLHGLCHIAEKGVIIKDTDDYIIDRNWLNFGIEKVNDEAKRYLINWDSPKLGDVYWQENPILQLSFHNALNQIDHENVDNLDIKNIFILSVFPAFVMQEKIEANQSYQNTQDLVTANKKMHLFFRIICTTSPIYLNNYYIENIESLFNMCFNAKSHESIIFISQAIGFTIMTYIDNKFTFFSEGSISQDSIRSIDNLIKISMEYFTDITNITNKYFSTISGLSDNHQPTLDLKEISNFHTIARICLLSHILPRILALVDHYYQLNSADYLKTLKNQLENKISILIKLFTIILIEYKKIWSIKIKSEEILLQELFEIICISLKQLGSFGYILDSSSIKNNELTNNSHCEHKIFEILVQILYNNTNNNQQLRSLMTAICGLFINSKNDISVSNNKSDENNISTHLVNIDTVFRLVCSEKSFYKKVESQIVISEAIPYIIGKWSLIKSKQYYFGSLSFPFNAISTNSQTSSQEQNIFLEHIADVLVPNMISSVHFNERFAAAAWVGNLSLFCSNLIQNKKYLVSFHKSMCLLLIDPNEIVQSTAAKCLSLLYDLSDSTSAKAEMMYSIIDTIGKKRVQFLATDINSNTNSTIFSELIPDNQSNDTLNSQQTQNSRTNLNSNRSFQINTEICQTFRCFLDLAIDINHPEIFYSFIVLAGKGLSSIYSFGPSYYSLKAISNAIKTTLPFTNLILPKLYFTCFNVKPSIAKTSNFIWNALFATIPPNISYNDSNNNCVYPTAANIIFQNWENVYSECIKNMASSDWKNRQCSCRALVNILQESNDIVLQPNQIEFMWQTCFRLLDDIKDSVRSDALILCNSLSKTTLEWCNMDIDAETNSENILDKSLNEDKNQQKDKSNKSCSLIILSAIVPLFIDVGLNSPSKDVRFFAIEFLFKLTKKPTIEPFASKIIIKMLECLSGNEDETINFISQNATNWNIETSDLDSYRLTTAKSSKTMEIIDTCIKYLNQDNMKNFIEQIKGIILHGIGLPTRAGTARLISNLAINFPELARPYSTTLIKNILSVTKKSNQIELQVWANAVAPLSNLMSEKMFAKLCEKLYNLYFEEGVNSRVVAATLLFQIAKKAPSDLKNNLDIVALIYFGLHDENKSISSMFKDLWVAILDNVSPATIKQRYTQSIIIICTKALDMTDWAIIKQSLMVLSEVSKLSIFYDSYPNTSVSTVSEIYLDKFGYLSDQNKLKARNLAKLTEVDWDFLDNLCSPLKLISKIILGRNWPGKDTAIISFTSILVATQPLVTDDKFKQKYEQFSDITKISKVYLSALSKCDFKTKRTLISQFGRFAKTFNINCFEDVNAIFLNIISDSESNSLENKDTEVPKPLRLALQATTLSSYIDYLPNDSFITGKHAMEIMGKAEHLVINGIWNVKQPAVELSLGLFVHLLTPILVETCDSKPIYNEDIDNSFFKLIGSIMSYAFLDTKSTNLRLLAIRIAQFTLKNLKDERYNYYSKVFTSNEFTELSKNAKDILIRAQSDPDSNLVMQSSRILATIIDN
ncbi:hypothetical protein BB561_001017 [Smittium simulii]|uniref:Uncharacterized protein n=1 Tax=Smittium simulii TaxID=133385 RepID=A0A2T9YWH2_9FUNG|nr:hypothetical protein BB561_001017 [Smittium simulii]